MIIKDALFIFHCKIYIINMYNMTICIISILLTLKLTQTIFQYKKQPKMSFIAKVRNTKSKTTAKN